MVSDELQVVRLGSRVRFRGGDMEEEYRIVAAEEADAMRSWISEKCPIGQALLGHRVGDVVKVRAPGGSCTLTVLTVD